jgi:hypothetical protein
LSLFEKSGLVLKPNEAVVRTGRCKGKVPTEKSLRIKYGFHGGFGQKMEWDDVDGELVLTDHRLVVVGERGHMKKQIIPFLDLELEKVTAVSTAKPLVGKEKLILSLNLGTDKPEQTEFEVNEATGWVSAIRSQIGGQRSQKPLQPQQPIQPQQPMTRQAGQYCINCGTSLPVGSKFCSHCGSAQI